MSCTKNAKANTMAALKSGVSRLASAAAYLAGSTVKRAGNTLAAAQHRWQQRHYGKWPRVRLSGEGMTLGWNRRIFDVYGGERLTAEFQYQAIEGWERAAAAAGQDGGLRPLEPVEGAYIAEGENGVILFMKNRRAAAQTEPTPGAVLGVALVMPRRGREAALRRALGNRIDGFIKQE